MAARLRLAGFNWLGAAQVVTSLRSELSRVVGPAKVPPLFFCQPADKNGQLSTHE